MIKFQDLLNKKTTNILNGFKVVYLKELDELKKSYYTLDETDPLKEDRKQRIDASFFPLIKYIIKDTNLDVEYEINNEKFDKTYMSTLQDKRVEQIYELINKSIEYAILNKLYVPDTTLHVWISDRIPWYNDIDKKFPIFLFAKPLKTNYLLLPDNTFGCLTISQKYVGLCHDWDKVKNIIVDNCSNIELKDKTNQMYFKGTATTVRNSRIRENLQKYSLKNKWLNVRLDGWTNFINIESFCNYKFLLNLPGRYPWSNRFKYLFLMKSIIINIDVYSVSLENEFNDLPWISLINHIVRPNKEYINLKMTYYHSKNPEKVKELNYKEYIKITKKLKKIHDTTDIDAYKPMIDSAYRRVNKLNNTHINEYIYNCIIQNSKIKFV